MKRLITTVLFMGIIFVSGYSQYYDFPFIGWQQTTQISQGDYTGNFTDTIITTSIVSDSIINGTKYYKQVNLYGSSFIRSENGKVYRLYQDLSSEELITDFSLSIGDSFTREYFAVPGGLITKTFYVLSKDKILGPGQDSLYKIVLTEDLMSPFGGATWIEGVGDHVGGLILGYPIDEMTFVYQLCTLNDNNQTIYTTEFFNCGCDKLYGVDNDRDGARNKTGSEIAITLTEDNFAEHRILNINACDTLLIINETGYSVLTISEGNIITPDYISPSTNDSLYFFNLEAYDEIEITHQFSEIHYLLRLKGCYINDCDDNNPDINPDQAEEPYNGIDDDCNSATLDDDLDQDGFLIADDCDDNNPNINPDQTEEPYNGLDDDCNSATLDDDLDQDGFLLVDDCNDNNPNINPNATEIPNNGIDEDCDGMDLLSATHEIANTIVNIYPNPATNIINIEVDGQINFKANLYDLNGQLIRSTNNKGQILISSLPTGTYLLEIQDINSDQKIVERIIIEK